MGTLGIPSSTKLEVHRGVNSVSRPGLDVDLSPTGSVKIVLFWSKDSGVLRKDVPWCGSRRSATGGVR